MVCLHETPIFYNMHCILYNHGFWNRGGCGGKYPHTKNSVGHCPRTLTYQVLEIYKITITYVAIKVHYLRYVASYLLKSCRNHLCMIMLSQYSFSSVMH